MAQTKCPERQALLQYAAGRGEESLRRTIRLHLDGCPECRQVLAAADITVGAEQTSLEMDEQLMVAGSHLGGSSSANLSAEPTVALCASREVAATRFDLHLLEPPRQPPALGRLGKYDVLDVLGYGGMGVVFRAHDEQLQRAVAIKVMSRELASSATARRRFHREARAAAAINHPNVITIHAVEEHNGTPFLVMEQIQGESLRDRLRHGPRLELVDVLRIASQVATGLAAAHAHGVIHRDIKPANIMLEDALQRVKITDFGLARVAIDNVELTSGAIGIGTPAYMAPEQVQGEAIDARTDLFALGCVMYAMLRGHSPFHGRTALEVARNVASGDPCPPTADPHVPRFLSDTIDCLLQKSPDKRFQSAAEVAEVLRRYLAVINQTPTDKLGEVLRQPLSSIVGSRQRLAPLWAAGLALVLLIVVGSVAWRFANAGRTSRTGTLPIAGQSALGLAATDSNDAGVGAQPPALPDTRTVSVAQAGEADYTSLNAALAEIGPGSTIRILDSGEYRESLVINDPRKWHDITIEGVEAAPPTILNPEKAGDAITIRSTPGVILRNLHIRQVVERQFGIRIMGAAAGVMLDRVRIEGDSPKYALVYVQGASGEADRPIVIRDSQIESGYMGIVVQAEGSTSPARHVHLVGNRFHGRTRHTQFNIAVQDIRIVGNVFHEGVGVELALPDPSEAGDLVIANNTFFQNRRWLELKSSSPELAGVVIANNLVLDAAEDRIATDAMSNYPLAKFVDQWTWQGNHWEIESATFDPLLRRVADIHEHIAVGSRESQHPEFLRLVKPLAAAPAESGLLPYVGALAP